MNDYKEMIDGLEMLKFFNQRAGRELWANKPESVQNTDIAHAEQILAIAADAIEQLVRERDAAIHDLDMAVCGQESYPCQYCANYGISPIDVDDVCKTCTDCENWEWRGAQE